MSPINYSSHVNPKKTPQTEKAKPNQVANSAGGFTFQVDKWSQLQRFLILGAEGGTYYISERKLTQDNTASVQACVAENGLRAVDEIVAVSTEGRAPKNDPAVFALALAACSTDVTVRQAAYEALPRVCRIGTHLFQFVEAINTLRGWGRGPKKGIAKWYTEKTAADLAHQVLKYQARNGWSHKNVLQLVHAVAANDEQAAVLRWIFAGGDMSKRSVVKQKDGVAKEYPAIAADKLPVLLRAYEGLKATKDKKTVLRLITEHRLTHEMVPGEWKADADVWEALSVHMPLGALVRNLGKLSSLGLIAPLSRASKRVTEALGSQETIQKARLHPLALLGALRVYRSGHGVKGSLSWTAVPQVVTALNEAFYLAFKAITPTGKNTLLALDVSSSMRDPCPGLPMISCAEGAAVMAMVTARAEPNWHVVGFTGNYMQSQTKLVDLGINPTMSLEDVMLRTRMSNFGTTDCSLPMTWARENKIEVDSFAVYTDNETYAGTIHPHQALEAYRQKMGRPAKEAVIGMVGNPFTIADPSDPGQLDVVGMDTAVPAVLADFFRDATAKREPLEAVVEESVEE